MDTMLSASLNKYKNFLLMERDLAQSEVHLTMVLILQDQTLQLAYQNVFLSGGGGDLVAHD